MTEVSEEVFQNAFLTLGSWLFYQVCFSPLGHWSLHWQQTLR